MSEAEVVDCVGESGASAASKSLIIPRDMRLARSVAAAWGLLGGLGLGDFN